jgi:uncharacterized repeat protein (TIGR01451 family)
VTNDTPTTFTVDRKIDLVVTNNDTTTVSAYPSSSTSYLTFVVTNTGNDTQDFYLFAEQANDMLAIDINNNGADAGDVDDTFDLTGYTIVVESGDAPGYDVLDVATYIDDLTYDDGGGTDNQHVVYVIGTMPADNGGTAFVAVDISGVTLFAEVRETTHDGVLANGVLSAAGADTAGEDTIFADGFGEEDATVDAGGAAATDDDVNRDAIYGEMAAFQVLLANVTVAKIESVIWDPVNFAISPFRIPGAIVEYTITITNSSGVDVTLTSISDDLDTGNAGTQNVNLGLDLNADSTPGDVVYLEVQGSSRGTDSWTLNLGANVTYTGDPGGTISFDLTNLLPIDGAVYPTLGLLKNTEVLVIKFTNVIL